MAENEEIIMGQYNLFEASGLNRQQLDLNDNVA